MAKPSISIIIPTINRGSLELTIKSVYDQLSDDDEIIVVGDGPCPNASAVCGKYEKIKYFEIPKFGYWGARCRDFGIEKAEKDFIWFLDDDDSAVEESIENIKISIDSSTDEMYIFKMRNPDVWYRKELVVGNLSSQTLVVPNKKPLPNWGLIYAGDFLFAEACSKLFKVTWVDKIIAHRNLFRG